MIKISIVPILAALRRSWPRLSTTDVSRSPQKLSLFWAGMGNAFASNDKEPNVSLISALSSSKGLAILQEYLVIWC